MRFKTFFFFFFFLTLGFLKPGALGDAEWEFSKNKYKLSIPAIFLEAEVCNYGRDFCLDGKIWLKYFDEKNNFLLTGHSFTIIPLGAGVFYSLKDLEVGDMLYLFLEETMVFEIEEVFVTNRYNLKIEDFSKRENTLVIYSCFPLWSASERIVVKAVLRNLL